MSNLEEFLSDRYGAHLQSVSVRDFLLYADFLPGSEDLLDLSLDALIVRMNAALQEEVSGVPECNGGAARTCRKPNVSTFVERRKCSED